MRSNRITTALLLSIAFFAMTNCDKKGSGKATRRSGRKRFLGLVEVEPESMALENLHALKYTLVYG
jgi:hypothetical protein